jgi:hypothetical protein
LDWSTTFTPEGLVDNLEERRQLIPTLINHFGSQIKTLSHPKPLMTYADLNTIFTPQVLPVLESFQCFGSLFKGPSSDFGFLHNNMKMENMKFLTIHAIPVLNQILERCPNLKQLILFTNGW